MALDIKLATFHTQLFLDSFALKAIIKPLGDLLIYMNDNNRSTLPLTEVELFPLHADRQFKQVQQAQMTITKHFVAAIGLLNEPETEKMQLLRAKRPVIFYTNRLVVRGDLHVNEDAPDEDLLDDSRDFFPISNAKVFPIRPLPANLTMAFPIVLINHSAVRAYHR